MLHIALRSVRASVLTARAGVVCPSSCSVLFLSVQFVALTTATIYGVGAKPGEIPTDESQSTGLDRVQVLGLLEGVDVFGLEPSDSSRIGTLADEMDYKLL
jgi:cytochrome c oxidase subunit 5b